MSYGQEKMWANEERLRYSSVGVVPTHASPVAERRFDAIDRTLLNNNSRLFELSNRVRNLARRLGAPPATPGSAMKGGVAEVPEAITLRLESALNVQTNELEALHDELTALEAL